MEDCECVNRPFLCAFMRWPYSDGHSCVSICVLECMCSLSGQALCVQAAARELMFFRVFKDDGDVMMLLETRSY